MTETLDLNMRMTMTGADEAAANIAKVREAIAAVTEPARRTQQQVRRLAEAFDAMTTNARKAADAAVSTVERMNTTIAAEARQLRTELGTMFAPLGTSAKESTTAATSAMLGLTTETTSAVEKIRTAAASAFAPIAESMTSAADTVKAGFVSINEAMAATIAQAKATAKELAALNTPAPGAVPGSKNANLRAAAGRGHGGPHFRGEGIKAPGGHISLGSGPVMGAAAVGGYAVYEAMQAQDEALRLALTSQIDSSLLGVTADEYQRLIMSGSAETGDSVENVADAYQRATRGMQGVNPKQRLELIKKLLPVARAESKLKGAPLGETLQSFIELGHQTGVYDPDKLKDLSSKLSIASLSVNSSLPEFGKTLSYSLPTLHAEGLDADTVISMTAAMQNAGVNSTKSGTWIRAFYQGLLPKFGAKGDKHNTALAMLGLGSPSTWQVRDHAGNIDWKASTDNSVEIMRQKTAGMSESERATTLHDAFGERGSSVAALMMQKTVQDQFDGIHKKIAGGADIDLFKQYSENSSLQQAQQTWRDTQNLLIDIGQTALPAVNKGLRDLDNLVKGIADAFTGKGWGNLGKLLWDHAIKPDLGPLGRLNTSPPSDDDRQPPVDMRDPRRSDLYQQNSYIDDGVDRGGHVEGKAAPRLGWDAAMQIWAQTALDLRDLKNAMAGPATIAWQASKSDLDAIKDAVQLIGEGIAAALRNGMTSGMGMQNASFETGDSSGSGTGSSGGGFSLPAIGKGIGHAYSAQFREAFIRHEAAIRHIDPNIAMAVARSEGFNSYVGDHGSSFGDFQMHEAANIPGQRSRGLGDLYREKTGKNPADPRNGLDLDRFALDQVAKGGWSPWHGAARVGIHGRRGLDYRGPIPAAPDATDMVQKGLTRPNGATGRNGAAPVIHVHGVHDPEQAANHVIRKLAASRDYQTIDTDFDT